MKQTKCFTNVSYIAATKTTKKDSKFLDYFLSQFGIKEPETQMSSLTFWATYCFALDCKWKLVKNKAGTFSCLMSVSVRWLVWCELLLNNNNKTW